jgi:putative drug exporter of the RND superfamily
VRAVRGRAASWCHRHRFAVILVWVGLLLGLGGATLCFGSSYSSTFALPNTDSAKAESLLTSAFPTQSGESVTLVWQVGSGTVRSTAVETRIDGVLGKFGRLPEVSGVTSPYGSAAGPGQISADGRTAYATVNLSGDGDLSTAQADDMIATSHAATTANLDVQVGGGDIQDAEQAPAADGEIVGVIAAAIVLFAAFGSLTAMALPILTAIAGVGGGLLGVGLLSHAMSIADFAPTLGALIGLGVGIDYALFIVTRHRRNLEHGMPAAESVANAVSTSGRAVLFAGGTVCVALLGMFLLGLGFLDGVALAASLTVACTVLAALTLLPAVLSLLGDRVLSRKQRRRRALGPDIEHIYHTAPPEGFWHRWADAVRRRPKLLSAAALLLMLTLAIPTLSLRLGSADSGNDPASTTTRKAYDLLTEGFGPGFNGPLVLVAEADTPAVHAALDGLVATLAKTGGIASVAVADTQGDVEVINAVPTTSPESVQTTDLITRLRDTVIPRAAAGTGLTVYVGGDTATYADFASVLSGKLPLFLGVILALGFVLLMLAFRSLLIPATAVVMNLLAAAASFGVVTAFFEWGWGSDSLGMGRAGPVESFLPVMMLAILFGLSMDYQVFLVSRMHEEWARTGDNARAIRVGQVETSRVITAAATIMICVFCAFAFGSQRMIGEFGIGLATAVFLDAFVVRTVLVPAAMCLFGRANWWLPGWLDRLLPRLCVEGPVVPEPRTAPTAPTAPVDLPVAVTSPV